jgi:hypothetical protein
MLGRIILLFVGSIVVIGLAAFLIIKWVKGANTRDNTENVVDLNDRFNRARYMNQENN